MQGTGKYYCSNFGQTNPKGKICKFAKEKCPEAHVDHVFPKALGGADCIHNLRIMCSHCNESKGAKETKSAIAFKDNKSKGELNSYQKRKLKKALEVYDANCEYDGIQEQNSSYDWCVQNGVTTSVNDSTYDWCVQNGVISVNAWG